MRASLFAAQSDRSRGMTATSRWPGRTVVLIPCPWPLDTFCALADSLARSLVQKPTCPSQTVHAAFCANSSGNFGSWPALHPLAITYHPQVPEQGQHAGEAHFRKSRRTSLSNS